MALNHVKIVNSYWGSSEPKMVSQQASWRFLKTTTEGELMKNGGNLFHGSTIRTEKRLFDEPDEKSDDATSGREG